MASKTQSPIDPAATTRPEADPAPADPQIAQPTRAGKTAHTVVAIRDGYYDASVRRKGTTFTIYLAEGEPWPKWVVAEGQPIPRDQQVATQLMTNVRQSEGRGTRVI